MGEAGESPIPGMPMPPPRPPPAACTARGATSSGLVADFGLVGNGLDGRDTLEPALEPSPPFGSSDILRIGSTTPSVDAPPRQDAGSDTAVRSDSVCLSSTTVLSSAIVDAGGVMAILSSSDFVHGKSLRFGPRQRMYRQTTATTPSTAPMTAYAAGVSSAAAVLTLGPAWVCAAGEGGHGEKQRQATVRKERLSKRLEPGRHVWCMQVVVVVLCCVVVVLSSPLSSLSPLSSSLPRRRVNRVTGKEGSCARGEHEVLQSTQCMSD